MEKIKAAAILLEDGQLLSLPPPNRHNDIMSDARVLLLSLKNSVQGFVTDKGDRFVTREEAYKIAKASDQIIYRPDVTLTPGTLYTEDLW